MEIIPFFLRILSSLDPVISPLFQFYQRICLFRPLCHKLQLLSNSSFSKFQLPQATSISSCGKFWLLQILAPTGGLSISGCEKFWLLQFLKNSSFSRFQLQKIPASPNSGFLRRPILKQAAKNSGFEEFCL